jgi:transglutaminase-like putative cysteine protease
MHLKLNFMIRYFLLALLVGISSQLHAQKPPIKFGTVTVKDFEPTLYMGDTSAQAVMLMDYGNSQMSYNQNTGFSITFERITRLRILKKEGYEWADFEVPLFRSGNEKERINGLKASTYNVVGGKVVESKMKSDGVFEEEMDENLTMVKFTLPNVQEGSILEVTYRVTSPLVQYMRDWDFQLTIPTLHSEYRMAHHDFFHYEKYTQGYVSPKVNESKQNSAVLTLVSKERSEGRSATKTAFDQTNINYFEHVYRWVYTDVPAFKTEPFMTSRADYISRINVELSSLKFPNQPVKPFIGSWADLNRTFLEAENFGKAASGSPFLRKISEEVVGSSQEPMEKTAKIFSYVRNTVEWNGRSRKYASLSFRDLLDKKVGSSADINLLLVNMLNKVGVLAEPVLISTRDNGFVRESFALSTQFNYVICKVSVPGGYILLDATDRLLPIGTLPARCINGRGFTVSQHQSGWVSLDAPKSRKAVQSVTQWKNNHLECEVKIENTGYYAHQTRRKYYKSGEDNFLNEFSSSVQATVLESQVENMGELGEPTREIYTMELAGSGAQASILYIDPLPFFRMDENPFKAEKRIYPIDFGSVNEEVLMNKIIIPDGYEVDELPENKIVALPERGGRYVFSVNRIGNEIHIMSQLIMARSLYSAEEYASLKEFYNLAVSKQAEQIVLKKQ